MKEIIAVILIAVAVSTLLLQVLGFITPFWACGKYHENTTVSRNRTEDLVCDIEGLFYTCNGLKCQPNVLDSRIFGLCLTSLTITCFTALLLTKFGYNTLTTKATIDWQFGRNKETFAFVLFLIGQLLAGVACAMMLIVYEVTGWSAVLFTTLALPVVTVASFIASVIVFVWLCACLTACSRGGKD